MIELAELKIPQAVRPYADRVVAATDAVCLEHLDEEYADLCRCLVGKLARKRPSPLAQGDVGIWAAGVVYAIGQLNFLFDKSQMVHLARRLPSAQQAQAFQMGLIPYVQAEESRDG